MQELFSAVDLASDYNCKVPEKDWLAYQAAEMHLDEIKITETKT